MNGMLTDRQKKRVRTNLRLLIHKVGNNVITYSEIASETGNKNGKVFGFFSGKAIEVVDYLNELGYARTGQRDSFWKFDESIDIRSKLYTETESE